MISKWDGSRTPTPSEEIWLLGFGAMGGQGGELRQLVHRRMGEALLSSPKPLLREACERLYGDLGKADGERWLSTARALRRVLVAEARQSAGDRKRTPRGMCRGAVGRRGDRALEILAVDRGLRALEILRPELARLVELRYFGGLSTEQTSEILAVSKHSLEADWRVARLYLRRWVRDAAG